MFKVLLWDLDNTILDFNLAQRNSLIHLFERHSLGECTDDIINKFAEINARHWQMLERGEITKKALGKSRFKELLEYCGIVSEVSPAALDREFEDGICHTISFIDDSFGLLSFLKRNYALYCITNGDKNVQRQRIKVSMLHKVYSDVFISEEIGCDKPSKEFFDYVLKHIIPCKKDEILIIGDSLTSDMRGANNAGIKCCWFNPNGAPKPEDIKIDYEIKELKEIIKTLMLRIFCFHLLFQLINRECLKQ